MQLEEFLSLVDDTIRLNLVISLYVDGKLSLRQATKYAGLGRLRRLDFQSLVKDYLDQSEASAIPTKPYIEPDEEKRFARDFQKAAADHPGMLIRFDFVSAWYLLEAIQLVCSHPKLAEEIKENLTNLGRALESDIAILPGLREVARRGWNR